MKKMIAILFVGCMVAVGSIGCGPAATTGKNDHHHNQVRQLGHEAGRHGYEDDRNED